MAPATSDEKIAPVADVWELACLKRINQRLKKIHSLNYSAWHLPNANCSLFIARLDRADNSCGY
jgi:hypothetical protein